MRWEARFTLVLALAVLLASALAACGGSDDSAQSTAAVAPEETAATTEAEGSPRGGKEPSRSGQGSAGFITPGGDNSIQNFGQEADEAEREEAASALESYMRAFAAGNWAKSCRYLSDSAVRSLRQFAAGTAKLEGKGCAALLPPLVTGAPASDRANTVTDGVASLRVGGERAFALYHGPDGVDYFMPMEKQGGTWKVTTLSPQEFP
jgi:hypothetical protein